MKRRIDLEVPDLEMLWCEVRLHNNKFLFGVIYRPPNSLTSFWDKFQDSIDLAKATGINNIVISGDLNADPQTLSGNKLNILVTSNFLNIHVKD